MKRIFTIVLFAATMLCVSCIDRDFDLADTSGEVTVGGEQLVVPLGEIDRILLGDLIKDNEAIKSDENGTYQILFSSFGDDPTKYEQLSIDGINIPAITGLSPKLNPLDFTFQQMPEQLAISGIGLDYAVDFPEIKSLMKVVPINISKNIELNLPNTISGQGILDESVAALLPALTSSSSDEVGFKGEVTILEQLNKVNWVELGCKEHPFGAPLNIMVDLNGIQDINGGGKITLNVEFPDNYHLRDADGNDLGRTVKNIFNKEIVIEKNQRTLEVLLYLYRIDLSDHKFDEGWLRVDDHIKYSYDLSLNLCGGSYNLLSTPKFTFSTAPQYKDAEVVINKFELPNINYDITYSIDGLPSTITVERVTFKSAPMTLRVSGLEWISVQDNLTDEFFAPSLAIKLPSCMHFHAHELLDATTNTLLASTKALNDGIALNLDYIDATSKEIKQEGGSLKIESKVVAEVHMESLDGHTVLVSSMVPPATQFPVAFNIADSIFELDLENTKISWSEDKVFDINLDKQIPSFSQTVDVPEMISSIERIEIGKAGSNGEPLTLSVSLGAMEGSKFPVDELELDVKVKLGKLLHPTQDMIEKQLIEKDDNGDYFLHIKRDWHPNETTLTQSVSFDAFENIPPIVNGKIELNQNLPVSGYVKVKSGENVNLATNNNALIDVKVEIDDIEIRSFTGGVDIAVAPEQMMVDLQDAAKLGVDINALTLNPVFKVKLKENPTGVPFYADIAVKTYDTDGNEVLTISVPTIEIAGTGASNIVISTAKNRAKYDTKENLFVEADDISQLLSHGVPAKIAVDMSVKTDKTKSYTIDLLRAAQGYTLEYQYEVIVPFEFDGDLDIVYESTISGLNETFANLANEMNMLKVGDVGLIAEFGSTIPFNIILSAELVNAEGTTEGVDAKLDINNCKINGYTSADGEKCVSSIDLGLNLGESHSLAGLKNADGVKFRFTIYNTEAESASLNKNQFLDGKLKLRVRDGLTVNIFDLLETPSDEE